MTGWLSAKEDDPRPTFTGRGFFRDGGTDSLGGGYLSSVLLSNRESYLLPYRTAAHRDEEEGYRQECANDE